MLSALLNIDKAVVKRLLGFNQAVLFECKFSWNDLLQRIDEIDQSIVFLIHKESESYITFCLLTKSWLQLEPCVRHFYNWRDVLQKEFNFVSHEQIPKTIPFQQNQKTNESKTDFFIKSNEKNITKNQNLEQPIEMTTLKVPNTIETSSKNSTNNRKRTDIKSQSNSSIEKTTNDLLQPIGLKSMKKSTSYVGNLYRQSGNNFNENQSLDTNSENKNEVVFVLGENEELKNLKRSTESVNKIGYLSENVLKEESESCKNFFTLDDQSDNVSLDKRKSTNGIKKNGSRILFTESKKSERQFHEDTKKFHKFEEIEKTSKNLQSKTKFQIGSYENSSEFDPKFSEKEFYPAKFDIVSQDFDEFDGDYTKSRSNFFPEEIRSNKNFTKLKKISTENPKSNKIGRFLVTKSDEMDFAYAKTEEKIFSLEVPSSQDSFKLEQKPDTSKFEEKSQKTVLNFVESCPKLKKNGLKSQNFDYQSDLAGVVKSKNEKPNLQTTFEKNGSRNEILEANIDQNVLLTTCSTNNVLHIPCSSKMNRPTELKLPKKVFTTFSDSSPDSPSPICQTCAEISSCSDCEKMRQRSSSLHISDINNKIVLSRASKILLESDNFEEKVTEIKRREGFDRSQSVPPSDKKRKCSKISCKKKYAGVKFDMRQYPQIVTQYMKSKDLELSQLPFGEKSLKLNRSFSTTLYDNCLKDFPTCDCEHDTEVLTTPSNASELEFTSDLECDSKYDFLGSQSSKSNNIDKEIIIDVEKPSISGDKLKISSAIVIEHPLQENAENNAMFEQEIGNYEKEESRQNMVYTEFLVPRIEVENFPKTDSSVGYTHTLLRGINQNYISDMVLQGTTSPLSSWECILKRDLRITARQPLLDQPIQEAVAVVANTDTWEVQLISNHSYVVERGCAGVRICLSQLVANMLESLLHMWKLRTPTEYCLMHIESKLREFCLHSKTMAQILMNTDFCNMDMLTSALQLEINDIPLLMAVASTHTPQVTQKYGLSFQ